MRGQQQTDQAAAAHPMQRRTRGNANHQFFIDANKNFLEEWDAPGATNRSLIPAVQKVASSLKNIDLDKAIFSWKENNELDEMKAAYTISFLSQDLGIVFLDHFNNNKNSYSRGKTWEMMFSPAYMVFDDDSNGEVTSVPVGFSFFEPNEETTKLLSTEAALNDAKKHAEQIVLDRLRRRVEIGASDFVKYADIDDGDEGSSSFDSLIS